MPIAGQHFFSSSTADWSLDPHETYPCTTLTVAGSSWRVGLNVKKVILTEEMHVYVTDSVRCTRVVRSNHLIFYGKDVFQSLCIRIFSLKPRVRCNPGLLLVSFDCSIER